MSENVWPTVDSIPVSAVTDDRPPGRLKPARTEQVAGTASTGRDTAGGAAPGLGHDTRGGVSPASRRDAAGGAGRAPGGGASAEPVRATGVGTAGTKRGARANPAAEFGFSGDPGQHGAPHDDMLHAQRVWDGALATNRMDDLGVSAERQRVETQDVTASVALLVDGRPGDVRACVESVLAHTRCPVLALDLGNVDGAGDVLDELAGREPDRVHVWHVAERPAWLGGTATWGAARAKLLRLDRAEVHVLMDPSVVLTGDALTPLIAAVREGAVAAGRQGRKPADDGRHGREPADGEWLPAGPGRVPALTGDLMAVRRSAAIGALPEDSCDGAGADLELSRRLKGELVVPDARLPVHQERAHAVGAARPGRVLGASEG